MERLAPRSHLVLIEQYRLRHETGLRSGDISPTLYPQVSLGAFLLILYLLVPQNQFPQARYLKIPVFICILYFQATVIHNCRSLQGGVGFGVGILSAWAALWSATLILFTDPQKRFKRIQRQKKNVEQDGALDSRTASGQALSTAVDGTISGQTRHSGVQPQATTSTPNNSRVLRESLLRKPRDKSLYQSSGSKAAVQYYWQSFPQHSFLERLDWVMDVVCNFRGMGWNWQLPTLPGPPQEVRDQLAGQEMVQSNGTSRSAGPTGNFTYYSREALLRQKLTTFFVCYIILDVCKVVMMKDPYFWGLVDDPPPQYLPQALRESSGLVRSYRLILSLVAIDAALQEIFVLAPLFFVGILRDVEFLNARGEPWMYPDFFGSYRSVLDKGLAGWWGGWWHQSFRFAFGAPSSWIIEKLGVGQRSTVAKMLQLIVAFSASGFLHASGSYTQLPTTHPLTGPFLFFSLQSLGIAMQMVAVNLLRRSGVARRCPKILRQTSNFLYVHIWFYYTAPILTNDFAAGGIWLFEPLPISPLRGLGFGLKEERWWCWRGALVRWHQGSRWWNSGLAL